MIIIALHKKIITLIIAAVLLCLSFSPSVLAHDIDTKKSIDDMIEYSNIDYKTPCTISLNEQQAIKIDEIFNEFKQKLDNASSKSEAVNIYKNVITKLYENDLLGDLSIEEAEQIVIPKSFRDSQLSMGEIIDKSNSNAMCLIAGELFGLQLFWSIISIFFSCSIFNLFDLVVKISTFIWNLDIPLVDEYVKNLISNIDAYLLYLAIIAWVGTQLVSWQSPALLKNIVIYQDVYDNGWIHSIGLLGIKSWEGPFIGNCTPVFPKRWKWWYEDVKFGVMGFSGINYYYHDWDKPNYFLGHAMIVSIDEI